ncbi:sperm-associated antigen 17-like [Xenia sp. Carnegie-2017]|uniref:sperm-associated antigen 17-like n=1 Tax=Xenia sp. Carnegie-2017 TaxID=2897299 RepID=UPI001F044A5D|nr:sperm-associated antigen 17-like [Xenia sp. Carnegie-2017]
METEYGSCRTLFGNGSSIHAMTNGESDVDIYDGSRILCDSKGNVSYFARDLNEVHREHGGDDVNSVRNRQGGVYYLRTTSQHCCDHKDNCGNTFPVFSNGDIKVDKVNNTDTTEKADILPVPRFFVMHRDGTGFELLRHQDVDEYLRAAEDNVATAVLRTHVEGLPNVTGVTVLKPFSGGEGRKWLKHKDESNLIPLALRERDFTQFPPIEEKKDGPKFGTNAGCGLVIGNMRKPVDVKPLLTCPKVLVLRHFVQYEPSDIVHREAISAAFRQYGEYVTKLQLQCDNCLPKESRDKEEVKRANGLAEKYERENSLKNDLKADVNGVQEKYLKSVAPVEKPAPPAPAWKRTAEEWERDRIDLAKLEYGKHALRHREVPPYFETAKGQAFLSALNRGPDMLKLSAELDKQACPVSSSLHIAMSASTEIIDQRHQTSHENVLQYSNWSRSAVLENPDLERGQSPGDVSPVESSTPFVSRPVNPTPAQAGGVPTSPSTRPTNPTPRQASTVLSNESVLDSPRTKQSIVRSSTLESLLEMQHEVLSSDVTSSKTSCDNHDNLPNVIMGGKPGALPNSQFLKIEDPVRRKVQTASVIGKNNTRGFELSPPEVDMGVLKEGHTYVHSVILRNIGIDSCRFKVRQPPPSTGIKVLFNHGPIAAGMTRKLDIEMFAVAVGVSGESGVGSVGHHIEIIGENEIFYLPVSATILTAYEYDNRSNSFPQGYLSKGTRMIDNRPPSRDAIRPRRNHMYSDVSKQF